MPFQKRGPEPKNAAVAHRKAPRASQGARALERQDAPTGAPPPHFSEEANDGAARRLTSPPGRRRWLEHIIRLRVRVC